MLHMAEAKPKPHVYIKDILRVQVGFNWLLSHKRIMFWCDHCHDWLQQLFLKYIHTVWIGIYVSSDSFEEYVLTLYGLGYILDILHIIC